MQYDNKIRLKFLSGFAIKGVAGAVAGIYLLLIVFSYFQISSNKKVDGNLIKYKWNLIN